MPKNRQRKNKAGQHKPITQTDELVQVFHTETTPAYQAHRYVCNACGEKDTRRKLRQIPCKGKEQGPW